MKKRFFPYLLLLAGVGALLTSCDKKDDEPDHGTITGNDMIIRSISVEDGANIAPIDEMTVSYNNLVAINNNLSASVNGSLVQVYVSPEDGMKLVIPLNCEWNKEYKVTVPDGLVYCKDNANLAAKGFSISFTTQSVKEEPKLDQNLTNPNATQEAKALYEELLSNYGKVMYSGAMGGVAWETTYTDYINQVNDGAGYPKVVGFDFIHIAYSPANWIDYGDITPVENVWKEGSIPTITWHWNVPNVVNGEVVDSKLLSYNNTFSPLEALTPGTVQNEIAEADIKKVAGYLKLLQDANIPVLFRPFHEAAGDYTWGPWFWWGKDGTDATIQLWNHLRDEFENTYGLNNLIWVWTMQTSSQGRFADIDVIRKAYPGDEKVDIVGVDLYPDKPLTDQSSQFQLVNAVVEGKKIITLSEVGNLIDPESAFTNNALWSYFMNWYDFSDRDKGVFGFGDWNAQQVKYAGKEYSNVWAAVANSPYVMNR
ncbi:MAG: hypothetical protein J1E16_03905 [Muribaculaceae bacterium]|nr:hypothetical protein [Muribaculaceae bacterium]